MGEKHVGYILSNATDRISETMYNVWQFVSSSGQDVLRFAHNSTAASVSSSIGFGGTPVVTSFNSGSFIVIEPINALPSGYRWQAKIERASSTAINAILSTAGGWDATSKNFISNSALNPPGITPPVTDSTPWFTATPALSTQILISTSDLDTYISGTTSVKVPYFRATDWIPSNAEGTQFASALYVGGYIPINSTQNTNPVVMLSKTPNNNWATNFYWGVAFATPGSANSYNKVAPDYDFGVKDLSQCYATLGAPTMGNVNTQAALSPHAKDIDGAWPPLPVYVFSHSNNAMLGYFGKYNMLSVYLGVADGETDPAREYIFCFNFMFRWKPTA